MSIRQRERQMASGSACERLGAHMLSASNGHLEAVLRRAPEARVLWVHPRAGLIDPQARRVAQAAYEKHLLERCAFVLPSHPAHRDGEPAAHGIVDRYGDDGVGANGGSGRVATVNGYNLKGVGRTALVASGEGIAHASGGSYLEEAVREAVFAEAFDRRSPRGAVQTLAIIDTGESVVWDTPQGKKRESYVIQVRLPFLRPANFCPAQRYREAGAMNLGADQARVRLMFRSALEHVGAEALVASFRDFSQAWAHQHGQCFAERLLQGSYTLSNVVLDGRLVDFGAATEVPSWHRYDHMLKIQPLQGIRDVILARSRRLMDLLRAHVPGAADGRALAPAIEQAFNDAVCRGILASVGVEGSMIDAAARSGRWAALRSGVLSYLEEMQRIRFEYADAASMASCSGAWPMGEIWRPGAHATTWKLRDLVEDHFDIHRDVARDRAPYLAESRVTLRRDVLRREIYDATDGAAHGKRAIAPLFRAMTEGFDDSRGHACKSMEAARAGLQAWQFQRGESHATSPSLGA